MGFHRNGEILSHKEFTRRPSFGFNGFFCPKGYVSVAEAEAEAEVSLSIDVEDDILVGEEVPELLQEMNKEEKRQVEYKRRRRRTMMRGMGQRKYQMLRRRQVRIETEAWEQAAKERKKMRKTESNQRQEREKINKIINASATVTVHICTVTVAMVHLCTFLHPLMWVFFWSKCVK